jgi:hypothetical protein
MYKIIALLIFVPVITVRCIVDGALAAKFAARMEFRALKRILTDRNL